MIQSASEILSTTWSAVESASKLCVTLFLPALLFSEIGPLASWENLKQLMMKTHPLDIPHPWSHSESPHAVKKVKEVLNDDEGYPAVEPYSGDPESAPLLNRAKQGGKKGWKIMKILHKSMAGFMNPPMYGGLAAIIAGVIPFLHNWLFKKGAVLSPTKKGSRPPIFPLIYLFVIRFVVMPVISLSVVYGIRNAVGNRMLDDPVLIVEMADTDEETETAVAKTIVISYALTPLISVSVTAALQVVQKLY
ncbi:uncharacterized protein L201_004937 [Kwoniella dendrophila CBS 6074]|uniref:Uncharacterized protein n=1 Tax=Kwoniella dendrophila CBS 6074 TaxID=1295534 RepID=A0AAX4JXJ0_9TREE